MLDKLDLDQKKLGERFYLICLGIYISVNFMSGTTFSKAYGLEAIVFFLRISQLTAILVLLKVFLFDKHRFKDLCLLGALLGLLFIICKQAHELDPFFITCFILAAFKVDYKKILKVYIGTELALLLGVYFATLIRLVPNNIIWREGAGIVRAGLGLATPSDLAAHIFYLMLAYAVYRDFSLKKQELAYLGIISALVFAITNSRLDAILMVLLLLALLFKQTLFERLKALGTAWVTGIVIGYAFFDLLLTYFYTPTSPFYQTLDLLLSRRLFFGQMAFLNYPLRFLGQYIYQNGTGDPRGFEIYYFIDSAFVQALMMFGIIFFIGMLLLLSYLIKKSFKMSNYSLVVAILLIVFSMAINHHFWHISYNIIILATLAKLSAPVLEK